METKEWDLREADVVMPLEEVLSSPHRYAIVVQIVSVEQPWSLEGLLPMTKDPPLMTSVKTNNIDKVVTAVAAKDVVAKKVVVGKSVAAKDVAKKDINGTKDDAYQDTLKTFEDDNTLANVNPQRSKASFSFQFPGTLQPSPEISPEIGEPVEPEAIPLPSVPLLGPVEGDTDLDKPEISFEAPIRSQPPRTTRFVNIPIKEFEVESNYSLWHKLLNEPLIVTMYWISPSGTTRLPFAQARVDLFPVLALTEGKLWTSCKLEKIPEVIVVQEEKPVKTKKGAKAGTKEKAEKKDGERKRRKKEEVVAAPEETLPILLEGAEMKVALWTTNPFWSEDDIVNGVVMEFTVGTVCNLPAKVVDFGLRPSANKGNTTDPFGYTLAMELPGFHGHIWWDDIKCLSPEEKADIAQIRLERGKLEVKDMILEPDTKASTIPMAGSLDKMLWLIKKEEKEKGITDPMDESQLIDEAKRRLEDIEEKNLRRKLFYPETYSESVEDPNIASAPQLEPQAVLRWPDAPIVKRFLPGNATRELKDLVKMHRKFRGELARIIIPPSDLFDTSFNKYHGCFFVDLSPLLEEGCFAFDLKVPLVSYSLVGTRAGIPLIQPPQEFTQPLINTKATGKKTTEKPPKLVDEDPPLPVCIDPDNPLPNNAWELSRAFVDIKVQTSRPMEPIWKPPPEPVISFDDVIPPRPKQATVYNRVQMAIDQFTNFVELIGADLIAMHQDLTAKELHQNIDESTDTNAPTKKRFETKGEIRKEMVRQLNKQGLWHDLREEMKLKVLKVATEKYREKKQDALSIGKFEFCSNLYITLKEAALVTLKKMIKIKKDKEPDIVDNQERLHELADEYEAENDYKGASRCQQERLLGDNIHNPNIWFEYGAFCMRAHPKDQGKAEECWREALTLNKDHLFSLQALGCLMWHRGHLTQAEVLFRNAINLHSEEEHINWVLVSQVYAAEGKKDVERSCLKRAEVIFHARRDAQNSYSPPHQLLSPLWGFPFSISYQALSSQKTSGLFVDSAMLLLDLHLPKEAELILGLEAEMYTCTLDNKWCRARVSQLNGDFEGAQTWLSDALKIDKKNPTSWLLLGHLRYNYSPYLRCTNALQTNVYKGVIDAFTQYKRYLGEDEQYKFVYLEWGYSYFKLGAWGEARNIFLRGNFKNAELALVEGNLLDTSNFKIWAYLTLICLRDERHEEAEVSFLQGLKCVVDPDLLAMIAEGFANSGNFRNAESAYHESLQSKDSAGVRFQLAELYYKEGKLSLARLHFEQVVKTPDVTLEGKSIAISRLTELQDGDQANSPINRHLKNLPVDI